MFSNCKNTKLKEHFYICDGVLIGDAFIGWSTGKSGLDVTWQERRRN